MRLSRFMGWHLLAVLRRRGYTLGMKPPPPKKKQALPTVYEPGVHPLPPLPTMQERVLAPPPEPVEGLHVKYTNEMQERGHVHVASLTGQRAKVGDWIVVEDASLTRQRKMLDMLSKGHRKEEVFEWMKEELQVGHHLLSSDWRKLGVQLRSRLSDSAEVDAYVAAILARGEARQQESMKILLSDAPAADPHTKMQYDKVKLAAAGASRDEDRFTLDVLGAADQRWNKATKLDVVGVDAKDDEEREIMRRLLGPQANIT